MLAGFVSLFFYFYLWLLWRLMIEYICSFHVSSASLERLQIDQLGIGQLHWSTANYAPLQELALWDGLVAMYEKVALSSTEITPNLF